jgi:hypothetical protein
MAEQKSGLSDGWAEPISGVESLDKSGISNTGYLTKKGTPYGNDAKFNFLPPIDMDTQPDADIRDLPLQEWEGGRSFTNDGGFPERSKGRKRR